MALTRIFKLPLPKDQKTIGTDSSGIALFMVIASVSVLAIIVTEFTYIAQVSQMIAFGGLDQAQAHYLAKSGLKISLLRLKAYAQVKTMISSLGGAGAAVGVPQSLVQKIWSFPFFYPLPTNIPGMTSFEKEAIEKFQKDSSLEGKYSAVIESESSKYNLNLLLANYVPPPAPKPTSTSTSTPGGAQGTNPNPPNTPSPTPTFEAQAARDSLKTYLEQIWLQKLETDPDFASSYRDLRIEDLLDNIASWADRTYEKRTPTNQDKVPTKKEPFYGLSELHMLPLMDDELYRLFAPALTVSTTPGININTMDEKTLRALLPGITKEEVVDFFKFRDSEEADNRFKGEEDFLKYIVKGVAAYKGNQQSVDQFKADLKKRNIFLVTEETFFKITVQAQVNTAIRTIEAWVMLGPSTGSSTASTGGTGKDKQGAPPPPPPPQGTAATPTPDSGIKITYMRIF